MLGNVSGLKSFLMSIHILFIILIVSRSFLMLLLSILTMYQLLVHSWLSLPLLALCQFTFEELDRKMADLVSLAKSQTSNFRIKERFDFLIVVRL